jgi:hypothetical protein
MFKTQKIKLNHRHLQKNKLDSYELPVFAPNYNTIVLTAKIRTNSHEDSMYIKFLCSKLNYNAEPPPRPVPINP